MRDGPPLSSISASRPTTAPTVSVIMPCYNHGKYIGEAIESVLSQDYEDLELIIVDDCSSDGSREIIKEYELQDNRVSAIYHERNMGVARARNNALEAARGKYIAFHDSDDVWLPGKLAKQVELLCEDNNVVVWGDALVIDEEGNLMPKTVSEYYSLPNTVKDGDRFEQLLHGDIICFQTLLHKRSGIRFDERLPPWEDYLYVVDLASSCRFRYIEEPLTKYRIHGTNITIAYSSRTPELEVLFSSIVMERYAQRLSRKSRVDLNIMKARGYFRLGNVKLALVSYIKALAGNPHLIIPHMKYWISTGFRKEEPGEPLSEIPWDSRKGA